MSEYDTAVDMEKQWDEEYNKNYPDLPCREGEEGHHIIKANNMIQAKKAELEK